MSNMTYHDVPQLKEILKLQLAAREAHELFETKLAEADKLVDELKAEHGAMFIYDGKLFKINAAPRGLDCIPARNWVYAVEEVKEIR